MQIDVKELAKITLNPGDVLHMKLAGPTPEGDVMVSLRDSVNKLFPHNKVIITGTDVAFQKIAAG